jgi:hypothetical protein
VFGLRSSSSRTGGLRASGESARPLLLSRVRRSARALLTDNDNLNGREAAAKCGLTDREVRVERYERPH